MKRTDWLENLSPEELADLQQAIEYVRNNTQRRTSVLGWAQENTPKAYAAYMSRKHKTQGLAEFFGIEKPDYKEYFKRLENTL